MSKGFIKPISFKRKGFIISKDYAKMEGSRVLKNLFLAPIISRITFSFIINLCHSKPYYILLFNRPILPLLFIQQMTSMNWILCLLKKILFSDCPGIL